MIKIIVILFSSILFFSASATELREKRLNCLLTLADYSNQPGNIRRNRVFEIGHGNRLGIYMSDNANDYFCPYDKKQSDIGEGTNYFVNSSFVGAVSLTFDGSKPTHLNFRSTQNFHYSKQDCGAVTDPKEDRLAKLVAARFEDVQNAMHDFEQLSNPESVPSQRIHTACQGLKEYTEWLQTLPKAKPGGVMHVVAPGVRE